MEGRLRWEWHLGKIRWLAFLLVGAGIWYLARQHNVCVDPLLALLTVSCGFLLWRLLREEQRRALERDFWQRILRATMSTSDQQTALRRLVAAARDILRVEKVVFLLYDKSSEQLVAQTPSSGGPDEELSQMRVPRGEGVGWHVFESGQPYWSQDTKTDPFVSQRFAKTYDARAMLSVPLRVNNQTIGVLHAINKSGQMPFTSEDCQLLMLLGSQMALILANAQLHDDWQRERTLLSAILNSIISGVIVTDAQDKVLLMNPSAAHLLRVTLDETQGRALASVIAEPQVVSLLERARHSHETMTEEMTLPQCGNMVVRVDCMPVIDENGKTLGQVAVFHDITERRRLDQMQSEFIASVSHELRTPLTSIKAFAATLLRDVEFDRATQREFLGIINSQCDRLSRTINDLLQLSRIESGRPVELHYTTVDVAAVVQRVVRSESLFTSKHRFETHISPDAAALEADEEKLARILTNLVNNAVKYSPDGGVVTISAHPDNGSVLFTVRDEGIGIPENERRAIFEKFYQVDGSRTRRVGGSGVGLFLVKQWVDAHGGEIWVESEVGRGTTFFFRLPRCHVTRSSPSRAPMTSAPPPSLPQTADLQ